MLFAAALLTLAQGQAGLDCSFRVSEREAEIGQSIRCDLVVKHPLDTKANVDFESLLPGDDWFLLEEPKVLTTRHTGENERMTTHPYYGNITTVEWTIAALEPGAHTIAAPPVMCEIDGVAQTCAEASHAVVIETALLEGEDAPRPPAIPSMPTAELEAPYVSPLWFLWLPGGLIVIALAWRIARKPRPVSVEPLPPARDRLAEIDLELPPREYCAQLREHLRGGFDERAGRECRGLTDQEWLALFEADHALQERLAALLATCEAVRFGGQNPTRFAIEALQNEALDLIPKQEASA